jgi:hypothetical protein
LHSDGLKQQVFEIFVCKKKNFSSIDSVATRTNKKGKYFYLKILTLVFTVYQIIINLPILSLAAFVTISGVIP